MKGRVLFFASRNDLRPNMKNLETSRRIKYVKCGIYNSDSYDIYYSVDEMKNLGIHSSGEHGVDAYLVLDIETPLAGRKVKQQSGGYKYFIDQKENADSIVFSPGGLYGEKYLVHGEVATIYNHEEAEDLYKYFSKNLVRGFKKVREYYVGPEALGLSERVRMITINTKEPPEYDLHIEQYLK